MVIQNKTRETTLATSAKKATSFLDKSLGLIINKNTEALFLETRFGIHTFFLKKPIDIVVLSLTYSVVKIKKSLKPNSIFIWNPKYKYVLELPEGRLEKSKTNIGDMLTLKK